MAHINVILGGKTVWEESVPRAVGGYPATMDTNALERRDHQIDNDMENTDIIEYWLNDELVHRSVAMRLKTGIFAEAIQADFGTGV